MALKSKTQLKTDLSATIDTNLPDNNVNQITPANVRDTLDEMVDDMVDSLITEYDAPNNPYELVSTSDDGSATEFIRNGIPTTVISTSIQLTADNASRRYVAGGSADTFMYLPKLNTVTADYYVIIEARTFAASKAIARDFDGVELIDGMVELDVFNDESKILVPNAGMTGWDSAASPYQTAGGPGPQAPPAASAVFLTAVAEHLPESYLETTSVIPDFMRGNTDWWFAVKIQHNFERFSRGITLMSTNRYTVGYFPTGLLWVTGAGGIYKIVPSDTRLPQPGSWIVVRHKQSNGGLTVYVNGVKIIDDDISTTAASSTGPMWTAFGRPPTNPANNLVCPRNGAISGIVLGANTLPTDTEMEEFDVSVMGSADLSAGFKAKVTNSWSFNGSGSVIEDGAIGLDTVGDEIVYATV